jgi:prevent-host-death family protein
MHNQIRQNGEFRKRAEAMEKPLLEVTTTMLRRNTSELLRRVEAHPILITRYGKPAFILMSVTHYDALSKSGRHQP